MNKEQIDSAIENARKKIRRFHIPKKIIQNHSNGNINSQTFYYNASTTQSIASVQYNRGSGTVMSAMNFLRRDFQN